MAFKWKHSFLSHLYLLCVMLRALLCACVCACHSAPATLALSKQPTCNCAVDGSGDAYTLGGKVLEPILACDYVQGQGSHAEGGLSASCMGRPRTEEGSQMKGGFRWIKQLLTVKRRLTPGCEPGPPGEVLRTPNLGLGSVVQGRPHREPPSGVGAGTKVKGAGEGHEASHLQMFSPVLESSGLSQRRAQGDWQPAPY